MPTPEPVAAPDGAGPHGNLHHAASPPALLATGSATPVRPRQAPLRAHECSLGLRPCLTCPPVLWLRTPRSGVRQADPLKRPARPPAGATRVEAVMAGIGEQ